MTRRIPPVLLFFAVLFGSFAVGRMIVRPAAPSHRPVAAPVSTVVRTRSPFDECMDEALRRRMDPIEARHTCRVIADAV